MTYTQIALAAAIGAVILDLFILRTRVLKLGVWWVSYAIVIGFQFITNGTIMIQHRTKMERLSIWRIQPFTDAIL